MTESAIRTTLSRTSKIIREKMQQNIIMELNEIKKLVNKYLEGESSLEEESFKRLFFIGGYRRHLCEYQLIFNYYAIAKGLKVHKNYLIYQYFMKRKSSNLI
jgi:hypothetical protein